MDQDGRCATTCSSITVLQVVVGINIYRSVCVHFLLLKLFHINTRSSKLFKQFRFIFHIPTLCKVHLFLLIFLSLVLFSIGHTYRNVHNYHPLPAYVSQFHNQTQKVANNNRKQRVDVTQLNHEIVFLLIV